MAATREQIDAALERARRAKAEGISLHELMCRDEFAKAQATFGGSCLQCGATREVGRHRDWCPTLRYA